MVVIYYNHSKGQDIKQKASGKAVEVQSSLAISPKGVKILSQT